MNISDSIQWITDGSAQWSFCTNRSYRAKIRLADPRRVYNVPGRPGVIYNFLDDAYEKVSETGYVVTGICGEMWPIDRETVKKYRIEPDEITDQPTEVDTIELDTVYAAIMIPREIPFTIEVDYGEKAVLHGNSPGIEHGCGDYVLVAAKLVTGAYQPDFSDAGRMVNGAVFDKLYKPFNC